ncbi:MAG: hypothetical protein HC905_08635 [Bacteroidales bacterium]|nr:hypothetical protein [Bacteroidales bacterium]
MLPFSESLRAQTPGMIYENPGITVLDPNGDGYVSATVNGFISDDDAESEIDYVSIAFKETEPTSDPGPGPNCSFNDIVDTGSEEPIFVNFDGTYLRFRFRLGNTSPNSKGYSIFIDSDQKFGFTGTNKDPNAVAGNPGFEIEVVLMTNFGVAVYNVDGTTTPVQVVGYATNPYTSHCQKSVALTTNCGNIDVFYDFFIPFLKSPAISV